MFAFSLHSPSLPEIWSRPCAPWPSRRAAAAPGRALEGSGPNGGLRRGSTVVVQAQPGLGGLSLALSLAHRGEYARSLGRGCGRRRPGRRGDRRLGVDLRRVLFVPRPRGAWAESAADLLDGVDLLLVRPPRARRTARRADLMDRVRERGTVLIVLASRRAPWPLPADLSFEITQAQWVTSSRLDARYLTVRVGGRGAARARASTWWCCRIEKVARGELVERLLAVWVETLSEETARRLDVARLPRLLDALSVLCPFTEPVRLGL